MAADLVRNAKTPANLESILLRHYTVKAGDFLFLEWEKFTEDILVTSDRSALISSQTSRFGGRPGNWIIFDNSCSYSSRHSNSSHFDHVDIPGVQAALRSADF